MSFIDQVKNAKNIGTKKIGEYLLTRDDLKEKLENPNKSLEECFLYCASQYIKGAKAINGKNARVNGDTDEAVFSLAVHYYDEDDIKVDTSLFTNTKVKSEVTEDKPAEQIKQVKEKSKKKKAAKKEKIAENQLSFFDMLG